MRVIGPYFLRLGPRGDLPVCHFLQGRGGGVFLNTFNASRCCMGAYVRAGMFGCSSFGSRSGFESAPIGHGVVGRYLCNKATHTGGRVTRAYGNVVTYL